MKRIVLIVLVVALLFGVTATNVAAKDVVILACSVNGVVSGVRPIQVAACSKTTGVTNACPTNPSASCAKVLADFITKDSMSIVDVHPYVDDGVIYTLEYSP